MAQQNKKLILGTRGSPLALVQARQVQGLLQKKFPEVLCDLQIIQTSGDRFRGERLAEEGGKGLFVKEIEEALLSARIDFAVHSLKDVPGVIPSGLLCSVFLEREDPRDVFIGSKGASWQELPKGAKVGTSSPRREIQLRRLRPDWEILPIRGNVETRLRKVEEGIFDATVLAAAGLRRLGFFKQLKHYFTPEEMLPSLCQGIIVVETRREEAQTLDVLMQSCHHVPTSFCARAERAFLKAIGGDCYTPLAGLAVLEDDTLMLRGWWATPDGSRVVYDQERGDKSDAEKIGMTLAQRILGAA